MRTPPWSWTHPCSRSASSSVYGLVGVKTNITESGPGRLKPSDSWLVWCPIDSANRSAAEVPSAASLLLLCSGELLGGCSAYARAAMAMATAPAMIHPRAPLKRVATLSSCDLGCRPAKRRSDRGGALVRGL